MRASHIFLLPYKKGNSLSRPTVTKLLVEGGFVRKVADGLYAYLPIGMSVLRNIGQLVSAEMKKLGGQELLLPVLNPHETWEQSGQSGLAAHEFMMVNDRKGRTLVLSPRHEEVMISLLRDLIRDDCQLPAFFFQTQAKIKDLPYVPSGITNMIESVVSDGWSIHKSESDLNNFIPRIYGVFTRILRQCGLSPVVSEGSWNGRDRSYDFIVTQRGGDYRVVTCDTCDYVADQQVAVGVSNVHYGKLMPLKPGVRKDIEHFADIGKTIGVPNSRVAYCKMFSTTAGFVMAVLRADHEISPAKLGRVAGAMVVAEVQDEDLAELGFVAGFFSPLGQDLDRISEMGIGVVVDPLVAETQNLVVAGNARGAYFVNANFGRDFDGHVIGDISLVDDRHKCYHCGGELKLRHALKLGNIVRQDPAFTSRLRFAVRSYDGKTTSNPFVGSYWLALDTLIAGIAHVFQDKRGIVWPLQVAPYKSVLLVVGKSESLRRIAASIHDTMGDLILWDDRPLPFVDRLRDANRMGIPIRVIVSAHTLKEQTVTLMYRRDGSSVGVAVHRLKGHILELWKTERVLARND